MGSYTFDAADKELTSTEKPVTIPWIKGSDSVANVIMEKLCKGEKTGQNRFTT